MGSHLNFHKYNGLVVLLLLLTAMDDLHGAAASANPPCRVAVLDFTSEMPTNADNDWLMGVPDFLEISLQQRGVSTLERRQMRLILGERGLCRGGRLTQSTLRLDALPQVSFLIGGTISVVDDQTLALSVQVIHAQRALVEISLSKQCLKNQLVETMADIADQIAVKLCDVDARPQPVRESDNITWLPEAALCLFKGLDYYVRGDIPKAIINFHQARQRDRDFQMAAFWEAKAYREFGFPELAQTICRQENIRTNSAIGLVVTTNIPILALVAVSPNLSELSGLFVDEIKQSGRYLFFDPRWIGATAREIDLQLTGETFAPRNQVNSWLMIDYVASLTPQTNQPASQITLRVQRLLSGEVVFSTVCELSKKHPSLTAKELARRLLSNDASIHGVGGPDIPQKRWPATEPGESEPWETVFPKALALAKASPHSVRYLVGMSDLYSEWSYKTYFWNKAIEEIGRQRDQQDAAFWLASIIWRRRVAGREELWRGQFAPWPVLPLNEEFGLLKEWFPDSVEMRELSETKQTIGGREYSTPRDKCYIKWVYQVANEAAPVILQSMDHPDSARLWMQADDLFNQKRYEKSAATYEEIANNPEASEAEQYTAAYYQALSLFKNHNIYEASEILKKILSHLEGRSPLPESRWTDTNTFTSGASLEEKTLRLHKLIRYLDYDTLMNCCGEQKNIPSPDTQTAGKIETLLGELKSNLNNRSRRDQIIEELVREGSNILSQVIRDIKMKNEAEQYKNVLLIVCDRLGEQAKPALPTLVSLACLGKHQNNAYNALGSIGKEAGCAFPLLILGAEDDQLWLRENARIALESIGTPSMAAIPLLGSLLYHANTNICFRAAQAISSAIHLSDSGSMNADDLLRVTRKWWETNGCYMATPFISGN